jgi:hypothetical protein
MPQKSDAIHTSRNIHLVTFSGAHSVGKSTLISELSSQLNQDESCDTRIIQSCSSEWFKRKQKTNPECKTYDDVNRLGLREEMQASLPHILSELIIGSFTIRYPETSVILCDRWFSDISAYTISELGFDKFFEQERNTPNYFTSLIDTLRVKSEWGNINFYMTNVFIPVSSCSHALLRGEGPDGKPRATLDQIEWEKNYNAVRDRYTFEGHSLTIQSSSISDRVAEVMRRIG